MPVMCGCLGAFSGPRQNELGCVDPKEAFFVELCPSASGWYYSAYY